MIKARKITRNAAMADIAKQMREKGYDVTAENVDNIWKSLLKDHRLTEDHNAQSGNDRKAPKDEGLHEDLAEIFGDFASRTPLSTSGSSSVLCRASSSTSSSCSELSSPCSQTPSATRTRTPSSCGEGSSRMRAYGNLNDETEDSAGNVDF